MIREENDQLERDLQKLVEQNKKYYTRDRKLQDSEILNDKDT